MITLIPIEPLDDGHGALIVEAFGRLLIDGGGEPDGLGDGRGYGWGDGGGDGGGWGGWGDGDGCGEGALLPDEWRIE